MSLDLRHSEWQLLCDRQFCPTGRSSIIGRVSQGFAERGSSDSASLPLKTQRLTDLSRNGELSSGATFGFHVVVPDGRTDVHWYSAVLHGT